MTIVITMAGLGSRFKKAGYTVPKYEIVVNGHTLFYWSMLSLRGLKSRNYIFIVRKEDKAKRFIQHECKDLDINPCILEIDYLTSGQAETAMLASLNWKKDESLFVYNIDTYIEPDHIKEEDLKGDGFIPCFIGEGDHWSFVRLNEAGLAVEVREKIRVSDYCSLGAYYFKTAALYESLYNEFYLQKQQELEAGERYIAPLYNYLIQQKAGEVYISNIPAEYVHVLGTPEEVNIFKQTFQNYEKAKN